MRRRLNYPMLRIIFFKLSIISLALQEALTTQVHFA